MNILTARNLKKIQGSGVLFSELSLGLEQNEKIALIGRNGCGKSTLARILAKLEAPDDGEVVTNRGLRISLLEQNPVARPGETILDFLLQSDQISKDPDHMHKIRELASAMGIPNLTADASKLSGGSLRRAAIARVLLEDPDLMILDEPTNHLDMEIIDELEKRLQRFRGALILVTHDRYFLDRIVGTIYEMNSKSLRGFKGSYSDYLSERERLDEQERIQDQKAESFLRKELEWIRRQPKARGTKQKARIDRFEEVRDREKVEEKKSLKLTGNTSRLGKKILEAKNISYSWGDRPLFASFSHSFQEKERLGIVGPNGCGKSTLLGILAGRISPSTGKVVAGETLRIAYFDQMTRQLDPTLRVQDYIKTELGEIHHTPGEKSMSTKDMLEYFLFDSSVLYREIGSLSGGEKRRLYLASLLLQAPNFLILDEPTNDFDIATLTALESYLDSFPGVVVTVSHDRWFLDRTASRLYVFEPAGDESDPAHDRPLSEIAVFSGGAGEYLEEQKNKQRKKKPAGSTENSGVESSRVSDTPASTQKKKLGYKEKREYEALPGEIEELEKEKQELEHNLSSGQSDPDQLTKWGNRLAELEKLIDEKSERYLTLDEIGSK